MKEGSICQIVWENQFEFIKIIFQCNAHEELMMKIEQNINKDVAETESKKI